MEMGRRLAITIAVLYWLTVMVAYIMAAITHDGLAFVPLLLLSMPWGLLVSAVAHQITIDGIAATTLGIWCWLLSGINAFVLYFLIDRFFFSTKKTYGEGEEMTSGSPCAKSPFCEF
jgi:hypothetical protein